MGWHGKPLPKDMAESVIKDLESQMTSSIKLSPLKPTEDALPVSLKNIQMPSEPSYKLGEKVQPRKRRKPNTDIKTFQAIFLLLVSRICRAT